MRTERPLPIVQETIPIERAFAEGIREKLDDPSFLPEHGELARALAYISTSKTEQHAWEKRLYHNRKPIYEMWTEEYIEACAKYIQQRIGDMNLHRPVSILEAGAGDGRFSHFLQRALDSLEQNLAIIHPVSRDISLIKPVFPVEMIDNKEGLRKYQPSIVLSSWMPEGVDFSKDFRRKRSVREYVLIGPPEYCGESSATWGEKPFFLFRKPTDKELVPAYAREGFKREEHPQLEKFQLSRLNFLGDGTEPTRTISFIREETESGDK